MRSFLWSIRVQSMESCCNLIIGVWNVGFWGKEKTGVPGEKPLRARERTNNKLNPYMALTLGFEPWPHWWEASALTTAPPLLPLVVVCLVLWVLRLHYLQWLLVSLIYPYFLNLFFIYFLLVLFVVFFRLFFIMKNVI